jgi:hypothetical protein
LISFFVFGDEDDISDLVGSKVRIDIHHKSCFDTDDRINSFILCDLIEFDRTVHAVVVSDSYGGHSEIFGFRDNLIGFPNSFEEGEGAMSVKVSEHL